MQIVIDIPKNVYYDTFQYVESLASSDFELLMMKAVKNGTPLPNTFDLEGLKSDMKALNCGYPYGLDYLLDCLKKRLGITIIEADK